MNCPECTLSPPRPKLEWKCDCGEISCLHVETCPKCLVTRAAFPGVFTEHQMHPGQLRQQIFEFCTFQTMAFSMGLNLQLAEMMGIDRPAATEQLFKHMEKNLGVASQGILKQVYQKLPVNEEDRVKTREIVKEFVGSVRRIAEGVKRPPPDIGIGEMK